MKKQNLATSWIFYDAWGAGGFKEGRDHKQKKRGLVQKINKKSHPDHCPRKRQPVGKKGGQGKKEETNTKKKSRL